MKWITHEHPKIDRIVCPWFIKRFIDKETEIIYAAFDEKRIGLLPALISHASDF